MIASLIAILPIAVLVALAVFSQRSFLASAAAALGTLLIVALVFWGVTPVVIAAAGIKGMFIAFEIAAIIFGALLVFGIFKHLGGEDSAKKLFDRIAPDYRVKAVLIAWALGCFLEGISGFGTSSMIAIPILTAIGFAPIVSVVTSLVGNTLPVTFGAVGLPVTYGFAPTVGGELALKSALLIAALNVIMAPIVVSAIMLAVSREKKKFRDLWNNAGFIIFASLSVSVPSFIAFRLFGPEMPSIIGGLIGILLISLYSISRRKKGNVKSEGLKKHILPFIPYIVVSVALATTRASAIKNILGEILEVNMSSILGTEVGHSIQPFALSATVFIAVAIFFFVYFSVRGNKKMSIEILKDAFKKIIKPATALACVIMFVQIMLNSGINNAGLPSMIVAAADILHGAGRVTTLFMAPFIGALGAFITGSSTVSNLLFSSIQQTAATVSGNAETVVVAMQGMGSAAGNVIGIHNILAALAVAGIGARASQFLPARARAQTSRRDEAEMEKKVLRTNLPFLVIYLITAGTLGLLASVTGLIDRLG